MSTVLNDRDAILQAATVRIVNPKNAWINLQSSAPGFHLNAAGQVDLGVVTVTADLVGLDDAVTFSAVGATLSNAAGRHVDVNYGGQTAIVTATVISNGDEFQRSIVIPVLRDGASGTSTPGAPGARGAGHYYATGSTWSDVIAQAACPGSTPVLNDVVTISSSTYVMEKRWTGSAWVENGVVLNGKLIAPDSILTSALAAEIIKAKHLSVGAVLASHVLVGPSGGLNKDPNFTDYTGSWSPTNAAVGSAGGAAPAPTYLGAFPGMQAFTLANELIPIDSTKTYLLSASVYADGGNDRTCTLLVNFYDNAGNRIGNTGWGDVNFSGFAASFKPMSGDWHPYREGMFGAKSASKKIPTNAKSCRIGVYLNGGGSSNTMMGVTALLLEEMVDSALVVKGGIKADHIDVDRLAAIIAYLGNVELGAGGAVRQGKPGYGAGKGIWLGDHNGTPKLDIGETGGAGIIWDGFDLTINRPKLASPFSVNLSNVRITQQINGSTIQFSAPKTITSGSGSYAYSWSFSAQGGGSFLEMISSPAATDAVIKATGSNRWSYGYLALTLKDLSSGLTATSSCEIVVQFGSGAEP